MYKKILLCLDNSDCSNRGIELGVEIAKYAGAALTGCHIYAARLHNNRFQQMESGLPPKYQEETELKKQRETHDTLITKGLRIISDSYITVLQAAAATAGITASGVSREGKNYNELVDEASHGGYDLVIMGAIGLGRSKTSRIGSVCERVVRRAPADTLVCRGALAERKGKILVAIDGSPASFGGLMSALKLSRVFNLGVEAVSAFDPDFHYTAFRSIAGTLSEEAAGVFKFKEQEKLHEEIIDKGLARIYQDHLNTAVKLAAKEGFRIGSTLLSGKPFDEIIKYADSTSPFMLVMGKTGVHAVPGLDIGSNTENCLREVPCHMLISARELTPAADPALNLNKLRWTDEANAILERVPSFARGIARNLIEDAAIKEGAEEVTAALVIKIRKNM